MSSQSNTKGRAYEFIWIETLYSAINKESAAQIIKNSSYTANQNAWENLDPSQKKTFQISAEAALNTLFELEPNLLSGKNNRILLNFRADNRGIIGDVRDIVISKQNDNWQIGLSIKHNVLSNTAV